MIYTSSILFIHLFMHVIYVYNISRSMCYKFSNHHDEYTMYLWSTYYIAGFFPEVVYFLQYLFYKISTKIKIAKYSNDYPIYQIYCIKSM